MLQKFNFFFPSWHVIQENESWNVTFPPPLSLPFAQVLSIQDTWRDVSSEFCREQGVCVKKSLFKRKRNFIFFTKGFPFLKHSDGHAIDRHHCHRLLKDSDGQIGPCFTISFLLLLLTLFLWGSTWKTNRLVSHSSFWLGIKITSKCNDKERNGSNSLFFFHLFFSSFCLKDKSENTIWGKKIKCYKYAFIYSFLYLRRYVSNLDDCWIFLWWSTQLINWFAIERNHTFTFFASNRGGIRDE